MGRQAAHTTTQIDVFHPHPHTVKASDGELSLNLLSSNGGQLVISRKKPKKRRKVTSKMLIDYEDISCATFDFVVGQPWFVALNVETIPHGDPALIVGDLSYPTTVKVHMRVKDLRRLHARMKQAEKLASRVRVLEKRSEEQKSKKTRVSRQKNRTPTKYLAVPPTHNLRSLSSRNPPVTLQRMRSRSVESWRALVTGQSSPVSACSTEKRSRRRQCRSHSPHKLSRKRTKWKAPEANGTYSKRRKMEFSSPASRTTRNNNNRAFPPKFTRQNKPAPQCDSHRSSHAGPVKMSAGGRITFSQLGINNTPTDAYESSFSQSQFRDKSSRPESQETQVLSLPEECNSRGDDLSQYRSISQNRDESMSLSPQRSNNFSIFPTKLSGMACSGKYRALVVGCSDFVDPNIHNLPCTSTDASAVASALAVGGYQVSHMSDSAGEERLLPTRSNIWHELKVLYEQSGKDDTILMYFATHGARSRRQGPVLVVRDSRYNPNRSLNLDTIIPIGHIEEVMKRCKATRKILLLDCCHQGIDTGRGGISPSQKFLELNELAEGFAVLCASTARQKAAEDGQHGVFTRFLLQALRGAAPDRACLSYTTFQDVVSHVTLNVRPYCLQKGLLNQQPTYRYEGMGDIIVVRHDSDG
eukprot:127680_1